MLLSSEAYKRSEAWGGSSWWSPRRLFVLRNCVCTMQSQTDHTQLRSPVAPKLLSRRHALPHGRSYRAHPQRQISTPVCVRPRFFPSCEKLGWRHRSEDAAHPIVSNVKQLAAVCRIKALRRLHCCALAVCGFGEGDRWDDRTRGNRQCISSLGIGIMPASLVGPLLNGLRRAATRLCRCLPNDLSHYAWASWLRAWSFL
jgi:hypothetical protein